MKKWLSWLLVLALCLSLFPGVAFAEDPGVPSDEPDEPVGADALDGPSDDANEPVGDSAPDDPSDDPEEPVGAGVLDGPSDNPDEPVWADAPGGPSDDPDALPEEPVADDLQAVTASGECGDNLTWTLENNVLTISGTGDMWNWSNRSDAPWNSNSSSVKTVVIQPGVTSIGNFAFYECGSLTGITIADGVTRIGEYAFGSQSLTTIDIPSSVKSIGRNAFWCAYGLTSVTFHEGLEVLEDCAFGACDKLTSVTIPSTVTRMERAFYDCSGLTEILVAEGNRSYSSIDGVLYDASGKTLLQCPGGKSGSFVIPAGVTRIGVNAFYDCESLTGVTIPAGVTSIGNDAFNGCSSLTSVAIPSTVTSVGYNAFSNCSSLTDVYYGGTMAAWKQLGMPYDRATVSIHCTDGDITADPSRCGDNLIWSLDENGTLTIAGSGDMWDWSYGARAPWNDSSGSVRTVVIQPGVTSIGDYAFRECSSLTSVTIPEGVTSIGNVAFYYCSSLTSVTIPEGVTSIGDSAFWGCSSLTSVTIPEGVTSIGAGAFFHTSLTSITIPEGVTSIGIGAFCGCSSLTGVTIPGSVTKITSAMWATAGLFEGCEALTDIWFGGTREAWATLGAYPCHYGATVHCSDGEIAPADPMYCGDGLMWTLNSEGVLTVAGTGDMWDYNISYEAPWSSRRGEIKTVRLLSGVTSIGSAAFWACYNLTSVEIPEGVTSIGSAAFHGCRSLTSVTIPEGVTSIGGGAFQYCSSLTSITIPESVTSIGYGAFDSCANLTEIRFEGAAPVFGEYVFGSPNDSPVTATAYYPANDPSWTEEVRQNYGGNITWVPFVAGSAEVASGACGANGDNLTWILYENGTLLIRGSGAMAEYRYYYPSNTYTPWYNYRDRITNLILPEGLTSIGGGAFYECKYISRLELPSTVKSIGYCAFYECSGIRGQLILPEGLTSIGGSAFDGCSGLTGQLILPAGLTSIGNSAFSNCSSLTSIEIPESVTSIGNYAFDQCSGVRSITLPSSVTSIGQDALRVGAWNTELKVYIDDLDWWLGLSDTNGTDLPHGDLYLNGELVTEIAVPAGTLTLRPGMFRNMRSLERVTIPESVTSIGNFAFYNCSSLTSITIPSSVTGIGDQTFYNCSSITSITIPESVTSIGNLAFSGCSSLTSITIPSSVTGIGIEAFGGCYDLARVDFLGDAPSFGGDSVFWGVRATALYPLENESWTADTRQNYGGAITWTPYRSEPADTPIAYAVAFDPNGGEAGPSLQYKGRGVDLSLTQAAPTRDYYVFSGWATDPAAAEPDYLPGAPYAADADVTLYAVWTPRTWTLQYLPSGGTGAPEEQVKTYGQPLTLSEQIPQRQGYNFLGWSTFYWDYTPRYLPGDSFDENGAADNAEPIQLYAVWQIQMYLISYKANGGDEAPAPQLKTYGRPIALSAEIPTRKGYTFLGWATDRNATEAEYQPGDGFSVNADTVLYAVWKLDAPVYDPEALNLELTNAEARPGATFTVSLKLTNNPGIKGISAEVVYDESVMTLVSAAPKISGGTWNVDSIAEDHLIYWYSTDAYSGTDVIELSFRVAESAEEGEYAIGLQFGDWNSVVGPDNNELESFNIMPGTLTVTHRVPGDINGDGKVSLTDVVLLARYVKARGRGVEIVPGSGDVNGDGTVNIADVVLLAKYVKARGQGVVIH